MPHSDNFTIHFKDGLNLCIIHDRKHDWKQLRFNVDYCTYCGATREWKRLITLEEFHD